MAELMKYNLGNPNSPKFNLFGYALLVSGVIFIGLSYYSLDFTALGVVALIFGGVVVTSKDGVIIDMQKRKIKSYTSFYMYKYGTWENLRNYGSVSVLVSHRVWKIKHLSSKHSDVTPREFLVCLLGKSHRKKQNIGRFSAQAEALKFAKEIATTLNLPIERYQQQQFN
ncbi:MAG: hypothetical protein JKY52_14835 [Flavobacteriales bacterium]|nr:hypothetical protein [Flavobacteriales bacterium]